MGPPQNADRPKADSDHSHPTVGSRRWLVRPRAVVLSRFEIWMLLEEIAQSLGTVGLREALTDWHFIGDIAAALFSIGFIVWAVIAIARCLPPKSK